MKLPKLYMSAVALAFFSLTAGRALAVSPAMATDEANACGKQGGFWVLVYSDSNPSQPEMCQGHSNGTLVNIQCGHCYYPSSFDCFLAGGTWHPAIPNRPLGYCTLPNGSLQTNYPGHPGGGDTGGPGGAPDCNKYGLIPDDFGGCCMPGEGSCFGSPYVGENLKQHRKPGKTYVDFRYVVEREMECAKRSQVWNGTVCTKPAPPRPMPAR